MVLLAPTLAFAITFNTIPADPWVRSLSVDAALGRVYVASANENLVDVVDESTNSIMTTIAVNGPWGTGLDDSSHTLLVTSGGNSVTFIDATSNSVIGNVPVGSDVVAIGVDNSAHRAVAIDRTDSKVDVIDIASQAVLATSAVSKWPQVVAVLSSIHRAYVGGSGSSVVDVVDTQTGAVIGHIDVGIPTAGITADPATGHVFVTGGQQLAIIDAATDSVTTTIALPTPSGRTVFNPSTGRVWVLGSDPNCGCIMLLDGATGSLFSEFLVVGSLNYLDVDSTRDLIWMSSGPQFGSITSVLDATPFPATPPRNVQASYSDSAGQMTISWQAPQSDGGSPVTGYHITQSTNGNAVDLATVGNVTSYNFSAPAGCDPVQFAVTAINAGGRSIQASSPSTYFSTVPGAPSNVRAAPDNGKVSVSWSPPASSSGCPITGYQVFGATDGGSQGLLGTTTLPIFSDARAHTAGTTYRYWVTASNAVGPSLQSGEGNLIYPATATAPTNVRTAPGPDVGQITIGWAAPSDTGGYPVLQYNVYRTYPSGFTEEVGNLGPSGFSFVDSTFPAGTTYYYSVSAVTAAGEGARSEPVAGTTPTVPLIPQNVDAQPGPGLLQINVRWIPPVHDGGLPVTAYRVYRGTSRFNETLVATVSGTQYVDRGLMPLGTYWYRVTAVNAVGESAYSNEDCTRPFPWLEQLGC